MKLFVVIAEMPNFLAASIARDALLNTFTLGQQIKSQYFLRFLKVLGVPKDSSRNLLGFLIVSEGFLKFLGVP